MRYSTAENWANYFEEEEEIRICNFTIRKRLREAEKIGITARNTIGRLLINAFYSEADVREACANLLKKMPQANKEGFFVANNILYATGYAWSKYFREKEGIEIYYSTISKRLKQANIRGITAKDSGGHIWKDTYFSETDVREACKDELKKYPQANKEGFIKLDEVLHAAAETWSKFFREKEGIVIAQQTISKRLKKANKTGITARASKGRIYKNSYFSETDVREACKEKLTQHFQANENGFVEIDGLLYATVKSWSKFFRAREGIMINDKTISKKLKQAGKIGITAKDKQGHIHKNLYFSESDVREVCKDELIQHPQANEKEFVEIKGALYATANIWSKFFKKEGIVIYSGTISKRLEQANKTGITARDSNGHIRKNAYFSETDFREACKDELMQYPQANEEGSVEIDGLLYLTANNWVKFFKKEGIAIGRTTISEKLREANKTGITAKGSNGRIHKNAYFSETDVRSACADHLAKRKKSNQSNS